MKTLNAHLIGRFGNACFQYCYARSLAERIGVELRTNAWAGQQIFEGVNEGPLEGDGIRLIDGYRQCQRDLIYTRADCRRWFKLKQEFMAWQFDHSSLRYHAHLRRGDFAEAGHVVVSCLSYYERARILGGVSLEFISEEAPHIDASLPFPWLADFLLLMNAPYLLRANSSFSWWAATLGHGEVWSPRIDGLEGGREHDVIFERGNHCRMFCADGFTDLHLPE